MRPETKKALSCGFGYLALPMFLCWLILHVAFGVQSWYVIWACVSCGMLVVGAFVGYFFPDSR